VVLWLFSMALSRDSLLTWPVVPLAVLVVSVETTVLGPTSSISLVALQWLSGSRLVISPPAGGCQQHGGVDRFLICGLRGLLGWKKQPGRFRPVAVVRYPIPTWRP
jgi:hypothetical protein